MAKRHPTPTEDTALRAFKAAASGKGGPLADLLKRMPRALLADAFAYCGPNLPHAVSYCIGSLQERERWNAEARALRASFRRTP